MIMTAAIESIDDRTWFGWIHGASKLVMCNTDYRAEYCVKVFRVIEFSRKRGTSVDVSRSQFLGETGMGKTPTPEPPWRSAFEEPLRLFTELHRGQNIAPLLPQEHLPELHPTTGSSSRHLLAMKLLQTTGRRVSHPGSREDRRYWG